jgi:hypothetical protein
MSSGFFSQNWLETDGKKKKKLLISLIIVIIISIEHYLEYRVNKLNLNLFPGQYFSYFPHLNFWYFENIIFIHRLLIFFFGWDEDKYIFYWINNQRNIFES